MLNLTLSRSEKSVSNRIVTVQDFQKVRKGTLEALRNESRTKAQRTFLVLQQRPNKQFHKIGNYGYDLTGKERGSSWIEPTRWGNANPFSQEHALNSNKKGFYTTKTV